MNDIDMVLAQANFQNVQSPQNKQVFSYQTLDPSSKSNLIDNRRAQSNPRAWVGRDMSKNNLVPNQQDARQKPKQQKLKRDRYIEIPKPATNAIYSFSNNERQAYGTLQPKTIN